MFPTNTNILLIDDMKGVRFLISKFLRELGYTNISEAENGKLALDVLVSSQKEGKPIQLIISDLKMPEMGGLDLLKHLRADEKFNEIPFILLTAEVDRENVIKILQLGVSDYIIKPTSAPVILKKLINVWHAHYGKKQGAAGAAG